MSRDTVARVVAAARKSNHAANDRARDGLGGQAHDLRIHRDRCMGAAREIRRWDALIPARAPDQIDVRAVIAELAKQGRQRGSSPSVGTIESAGTAIEELMAASAYMIFALRDGAVFNRDHAAQRLKAAHAACMPPREAP